MKLSASQKNILLTGATGFIGTALRKKLTKMGHNVTALSFNGKDGSTPLPLTKDSNFSNYLKNIDTVIHTAARVHIVNEKNADSFNELNVLATENLAQQALSAGVKHFIFLSSAKVYGEGALSNHTAYKEIQRPAPVDPYGISKLRAEDSLKALCAGSSMALTIIRPPLVYGPGVKANFQALMSIAHKGIPLPLGGIHNQRSIIYLENLVDFITTVLSNPAAYSYTFNVCDTNSTSTADLFRNISTAMNKRANIFNIPGNWLKIIAKLTGKQDAYQKVCGSLVLESNMTKQQLNWMPPFSQSEGIQATVDKFLADKNSATKATEKTV